MNYDIFVFEPNAFLQKWFNFPSLTDGNLSFFKKSLLPQRRYHILFVGKSLTICDFFF